MARAIRFQEPGTGRSRLLDLKLGFALMRDRRVPLHKKALAILIAIALTGLLEILELPVEGLLAMLLSIVGVVGDVVIDGIEAIAGPLMISALLLPFLAPPGVVDQIRGERSGSGNAPKPPIIDI